MVWANVVWRSVFRRRQPIWSRCYRALVVSKRPLGVWAREETAPNSLWVVEKKGGEEHLEIGPWILMPRVWSPVPMPTSHHLLDSCLPRNPYVFPTMPCLSGKPINPTYYLSKSVSNVINSIVFGDRFDYEDEEFLSLLRMMGQINRFAASPVGQVSNQLSLSPF